MKSLFIIGIALTSVAFSDEVIYSNGKLVEGKYYPHPEAIQVYENSIYVDIDGNHHKVDGLLSDNLGVYVVKTPVNEWKCARGHPNPPWTNKCNSCDLTR